MMEAQFSWIHLIAALALGLSAGWNLAIHIWNWQAKKARPQPDPLGLEARFKQAVLDGKPIVLTGPFVIDQPADRYVEVTFEREDEAA